MILKTSKILISPKEFVKSDIVEICNSNQSFVIGTNNVSLVPCVIYATDFQFVRQLLLRKIFANTNDVIIDYDMDLSSFGMKCVVSPQRDIDGLELKIEFLDSNKNVLTTKVKTLGNVKKGVQVSFSISIGELGLSVAWKTEYSRISVTGGTVSYFS